MTLVPESSVDAHCSRVGGGERVDGVADERVAEDCVRIEARAVPREGAESREAACALQRRQEHLPRPRRATPVLFDEQVCNNNKMLNCKII